MEPGDWFSAGGLVGIVVSITRDDLDTDMAVSGMGVKLRITMKVSD